MANKNPMAGKPDPRSFGLDHPQPDPVHDVDPSRLSFDKKSEPRRAAQRKSTATDLDKRLEEREGQRAEMIDEGHAQDLMLASNPMEETVEKFREPGMSYGFLGSGPTRYRGTRNYEIVKDSRGDPVTLGTLTLGKIPTNIAEARRQKAEKESEETIRGLKQQYAHSVNKLKSDARDMGLRVLDREEASEFVNTESGRHINIG